MPAAKPCWDVLFCMIFYEWNGKLFDRTISVPGTEAGGICLGITCVVDRTRPEAPSPIPILASALKLDLPNYAPEECPICKEGKLPLVHLGSRKMKEAAKQTL